MLAFWSIAALIWLLLLTALLKPLFRRQQKLSSYKRPLLIAALTATFVVASSAVLYVYWSNGYSTLIASSDQEEDMIRLTEQLAKRLEQSPDNSQGWLLLANSYTALGRYDEAVSAYEQAERYTELDAWAQISYAEALLVAEGSLNAKAKDLLEAAIASRPNDPQGLFLIGLANLEQSNYLQTISYWERLLALLEADDALASAVEEKLVEVRQLAAEMPEEVRDEPLQDTPNEQPGDTKAIQAIPKDEHCFIRVTVALDSALSSKMLPTDTLFVYAKASKGPPMPLAIKQFNAKALPLETCLGVEDAMIEGMTINSFDPIRIVARISKSGLATPQSGDLQAQSEPLSAKAGEAVSLLIDEILE